MIGGRPPVALLLLAWFLVCGLASQSAAAAFAPAESLTAYTCVKNGRTEDFSDPHCDQTVTPKTGEFGHESFPEGVATEIELTNAGTRSNTAEPEPTVLAGTIGGAAVTLTAQKVSGTGSIYNLEPELNVLKLTGGVTVRGSEVTVKGIACAVVEPIELSMAFEGVEQGEESGIRFGPKIGLTIATVKFKEPCAVKEAKLNGTLIATGGTGAKAKESGATTVLEPGSGMESLTFGGAASSVTAKMTLKAFGGRPLSTTKTP